MQCDYWGVCGSCTLYDMSYEAQLNLKIKESQTLFKSLYNGSFDIALSASEHFRYRAEFKLWHDGDAISYAMNRLDKKGVVMIEHCGIVAKNIATLMPKLLAEIKALNMDAKLFNIDFLSGLSGEMLVSLIYHKKLDTVWQEKAQRLSNRLGIHIIGRSRKQKLVIGQDFITEKLTIKNQTYRFVHIENSFTQPNSHVNIQMIEWVIKHLPKKREDLLELYCGAGNFTLPLSRYFNKVLATEISKASISAAKRNCDLNEINNITFLRMSSEEFVQAINKERSFNRLKGVELDDFSLKTLFLDPPRSGLDETTTQLAKNFDTILYISCHPVTLKRDIEALQETHKVVKMALFDQFAYSKHIEMGAILEKKG